MTHSPFELGTKNSDIFKTTAPYRNPYQGDAPRWLFVCSAGLLRSPTGATLAAMHGINARSAGSHTEFALIPVSANLINWADKIIFVNKDNYDRVIDVFGKHTNLVQEIDDKAVIMNIPDNYDYMNPSLVKFYEENLFNKYAM